MRSGLDNLPTRSRPAALLLLAAEDRQGLLRALRSAREATSASGLGGLSAPPQAGSHRLAVLATDTADLAAKLATAETKIAGLRGKRLALSGSIFYAADPPRPHGKIAFLFPGQGSQHPGMLDELCLLFPRVRAAFAELDQTVADLPIPAPSLLAFPPAAGLSDEDQDLLNRELYDLRGGAQLGVIANLALYDLVVDLGVRCDAMVGHSNGEHAALFASKAFRSGRQGLLLAFRRMIERAIALPPPPVPEAVVTVSLRDRGGLDELLAAEAGGLFLAMINCPTQCVLAGRQDAVERAARALGRRGGVAVRVPLNRAYHTPLFADWGRWLLEIYEEGEVGRPEIPLYSCVTGAPYPDRPDAMRALAAEQWSRPVDFEKTVRRLYEDGVRIFVEIGPNNVLRGFTTDILRDREHLAVATAGRQQPPVGQLLRCVGELFVHGVDLDFTSATWRALTARPEPSPAPAADPRQKIVQAHFSLMQEFLANQGRVLAMVSTRLAPVHETSAPSVASRRLEAERRFDLDSDPLLRDHCLGKGPHPLAVVPFTLSLEIAAEAAVRLCGGGVVVRMSALRASRWLALDRGSLTLGITAEVRADARTVAVRLYQVEDGARQLAFEGEVEVAAAWPPSPPPRPQEEGLAPPRLWSAADFYRDYAFHGPAFRGIRQVLGVGGAGGDAIEAALEAPVRPVPRGSSAPPAFHLDPALLDCSGQLVGFWLLESGHRDFGIFPFHLHELRIYGPAPEPGDALSARAAVRWQARGTTSADVDFLDDQGRLIYRLTGLEQRYLSLPPRFARVFLGSHEQPDAPAIDDLPHDFLAGSWGIWSRALAHHVLAPAELDEWYGPRERSIPWLLSRVASVRLKTTPAV